MELLIKNARIIDAIQDFKGDIYIKDGVINEIAQEIKKIMLKCLIVKKRY